MGKYNLKTIIDYINGDDIKDYDIDTLENDQQFMMEVMDFTKDKNIYNLCSNEMKNDWKFIRFMIYTFKDDIPFLDKIVNDFFSNNSDILEQIEIKLAMCDITKNKDYELYEDYKFTADILYEIIKDNLESIKEEDYNDYFEEGFYFIQNAFEFSETTLNYFAEKMIEDIFYKYINLEEFLHARYQQYEQFEETGVIKFIIEVLSCYDTDLTDYVVCHVETLKNQQNKFNTIKKNWNWYNEHIKEKKYTMIYDIILEKCEESKGFLQYTDLELLFHFANKFNILDDILKYNKFTILDYEEVMKYNLLDVSKMNFKDLKVYYEVQREILKILKQKNPQEYDKYIQKENESAKTNLVIDFPSRQIKNTR